MSAANLPLLGGLPDRALDAPEPLPAEINRVQRALARGIQILTAAIYSGSVVPIIIDIPSLFEPEQQASSVACSRCRRRLSSARSKERGLGPLCAKRSVTVTRDSHVRDVTNG